MKVKIIAVGKIKEDYLQAAIKEYVKRLAAFTVFEILEISEAKIAKENQSNIIKSIDEESEQIIEKLSQKDYNILLDIDGKSLDSKEFASTILNLQNSYSNFVFIIGGSNGVNAKLKKMVNLKLSFGKLTYPHQLMRVILLEQIYRVFKINSNQPYHK